MTSPAALAAIARLQGRADAVAAVDLPPIDPPTRTAVATADVRCTKCGNRAHTVTPYWDPGARLCVQCCRQTAATFDNNGGWPTEGRWTP